MGEYIKYKNKQVKIGTMEDMYYTSYQKYTDALNNHWLSKMYTGGAPPSIYADPDAGFRFRFPFPDEDRLPLGQIIEPYNRGIPIKVDPKIFGTAANDPSMADRRHIYVEITQQKLVHRERDGKLTLALVLRDPVSNQSMRMEEDAFIRSFTKEINRNHVLNESNPEKKAYFKTLAARIIQGYNLKLPAHQVDKKPKIKPIRKRGTGL